MIGRRNSILSRDEIAVVTEQLIDAFTRSHGRPYSIAACLACSGGALVERLCQRGDRREFVAHLRALADQLEDRIG